jgi:serine/threonine protein kinase/tetratricopeptide (TPR) repeat protein
MTPERWQEIKKVLDDVLELKPGDRALLLDRACANDASLRKEVELLLAAEEEAGTQFLNEPQNFELTAADATSDGISAEPVHTRIGQQVGPYKIVEQIGVGGMGEVYRAFRADDTYRKEVALKAVRGGQDSGFVVSRFRNERQILASLDHPNIARLLDGGTTEDGVPYFVMELIEGQPIDQYCDRRKLPVNERLKLFLQICSAVQYAHQRLIIHRDIKPSNILVTSSGTPKLLDFGIAKILDCEVPGQLEPTLTVYRILTPGYASPEQIKGEPITTASDVYSLGIVLYELLTGWHPYRRRNSTPQGIAHAACEVEPEKPSTAVRRRETIQIRHDSPPPSAAPQILSASAEKRSKSLRGDLDNIVLMALRKESQRRYASVEQFAGDIRRHLESLPVLARTDTFGYRASKFVARHRAGVLGAIVVTVTVIAGLTVTLHEAHIARAQQTRAEQRFNDVRELANSLMFDVHDSIQDLPGSTPARKLLVDRALRYLDSLARDAASDESLQHELGTAYEKVGTVQGNPFGANLGDTQGALESYRKALAIRQSLLHSNPGDIDSEVAVARTQRLIAAVIGNRGDPASISQTKQALATAEQAFHIAPSNPAVLQELQASYYLLAILLDGAGDYQAAAGYLHKELPIAEARLRAAPEDRVLRRELGRAEVKLGYALARMGSRKEGLDYSHRGVEVLESLAADGTDAESRRWLGMAHWMLGDILLLDDDAAGALQSYQEELRIVAPLASADPTNAVLQYDLGCAHARVGNALAILGNQKSGVVMFNRAVYMFEAQLARDPAYTEPRYGLAASHIWMGEAFTRTGNTAQALQSYERGLAGSEQLALHSEGTSTQAVCAGLRAKIGFLQAKMGKRDQASEEYQRALSIAESIASANPNILEAQYSLADAYSGLAELSQMQASDFSQPVQQQIRYWSEARTYFQHSLDAWKGIPNPGARTPVGFACGDPKLVAREIAQSDAALARLQSSKSSGSSALR